MNATPENVWPDPREMTLGARIKLARERAGLTQQKLGDVFDLTRIAVSNWERDKDLPETHRLMELPAVLRCPLAWLLSNGGYELYADAPNTQPFEVRGDPRNVPLISRVPDSFDSERDATYPSEAIQEWLAPSAPLRPRSFALRVQGDSMSPEFPDGCVIFVEPTNSWKSGDFVVVQFPGSTDAAFKRIVRDGGGWLLVPENPQYPTRELGDEFTVCGVVREMRRVYR